VPWETAFTLDDAEALAAYVVFAEYRGAKWNWQAMRFEKD
jgi:hypothetical protein